MERVGVILEISFPSKIFVSPLAKSVAPLDARVQSIYPEFVPAALTHVELVGVICGIRNLKVIPFHCPLVILSGITICTGSAILIIL
jgi:hypothetical protein